MALTPDNQNLVTAEGKRLRVWSLAKESASKEVLGHSDTVRFVAVQSDGLRAASCSQDRTIIVWKVETWSVERVLAGHDGVVRHLHFAAGMLLSCSSDETARLWSLETGRCKFILSGHAADVRGCAMSKDASVGYTCGFDKTVRRWDLNTGRMSAVMRGHADKVFGVDSSADGLWAVSCSWDKTLRLWDARKHTLITIDDPLLTLSAESERGAVGVRDQGKEALCVAISGDGKRAVSCSVDGNVRIWDLERAVQLHKCVGHKDWVWGLCITPDGALTASCSRDFTVRLWDVEEGEEVRAGAGKVKGRAYPSELLSPCR